MSVPLISGKLSVLDIRREDALAGFPAASRSPDYPLLFGLASSSGGSEMSSDARVNQWANEDSDAQVPDTIPYIGILKMTFAI